MKSQKVTHEEAERLLQANIDRLTQVAESCFPSKKFSLKEFLERETINVEEDPYKAEKTAEAEGLNAGRNQ